MVSLRCYGICIRYLTYRQLDLFAFTIRMPLLHRLATLRDDIIFFVYLYQNWKYKVDYTRYAYSDLCSTGVAFVNIPTESMSSARSGRLMNLPRRKLEKTAEEEKLADVATKASGSSKKGNAMKRR
jgi:hypothetical protein